MSAFEAYKMYVALKLHFTTDNYDYFTFNGKCRASESSFEKRKDRYFFKKVVTKFNNIQLQEYFVSNFILDGTSWVGSMVRDKGEKNYVDWKKKMESLHYTFSCDVDFLLSEVEDFEMLFVVDNTHPPLLKYYLGKKITLETFVILNKILTFTNDFDKLISEPFIWKEVKRTVIKYSPFINVDLIKYKQTLKQKVVEHKCLSSIQK
jgi:hypothetical protein